LGANVFRKTDVLQQSLCNGAEIAAILGELRQDRIVHKIDNLMLRQHFRSKLFERFNGDHGCMDNRQFLIHCFVVDPVFSKSWLKPNSMASLYIINTYKLPKNYIIAAKAVQEQCGYIG
jgi:hypothetical protein